ncbi:MAG: hypothetical protein IPO86_09240 [Saprospiraceae bacterium]|nr:hypothetical protein [Saprospiraceae bacterium]MBK9728287.1 hypothetical protein [Saprospiraceae bacterium]
MIQEQKSLPNWILIVSGLLALMELGVSLSLFFSPQSMADNIDLNAKGVDFLIYMWATRQFALGFIFAYATIKKSIPMLTLAYIFLLVMFVGDLIVGVLQKNNTLIIGGIVLTLIALALIFLIQKKK